MILKCDKTQTWALPPPQVNRNECWHVFPEFHIHYFQLGLYNYTVYMTSNTQLLPTNVAELELKAPRIRPWRSIWWRMGSFYTMVWLKLTKPGHGSFSYETLGKYQCIWVGKPQPLALNILIYHILLSKIPEPSLSNPYLGWWTTKYVIEYIFL